jgi:flavin-dependent dehydrogenase
VEKAGHQYDVIVAGGGPSGSACAITAARAGAKVLLLEKDRLPRHKVCGEFVSAESLQLLDSLVSGLAVAKSDFESAPEIANARLFVDSKIATFPFVPPARSIPRFDLDATLLQAARRDGVEVEESVVVRNVAQNSIFTVHTDGQSFTAKTVVNATGRWSHLTQYNTLGKTKWIGLKAHFREAQPPSSVDLYYFPGGYCGVTPVSQEMVNACAMVRADTACSLDEVFASHPGLWRRTRNWEQAFPTVTTSPLYFRKPVTCNGGMILIGDAAGFIDPFAGDGISLALQSGALAAASLTSFLQGRSTLAQAQQQYQQAYFRRLAPAFRSSVRLRILLATPSWLRSMVVTVAGTRPVARMIVHRTRARAS